MLCLGAVDREVTVVHLIDHPTGVVLGVRPLVVGPSLRVAVVQIHYHAFLTVHSDSLCKDTWRGYTIHHQFILLPFQVAVDDGLIDTPLTY